LARPLPVRLTALGVRRNAAPVRELHLPSVLPEERYLQEQFGEPYSRYKSRVRRYL